jgi:hypothetical protein
MEEFNSTKFMVLDTEYDLYPKRLLAISYIIYTFDKKWNSVKTTEYIKYPPNVFKVNESGESFTYHQLSNEFLQENGVDVKIAIENFHNNLSGVNIIVGQNVIMADIQAIRTEATIYDTMISFKNKNPDVKASLDSIYKHLFDKEMKNHHNPIYDCKNTFKCFQEMVDNDYKFQNQIIKFGEDIFEELVKGSYKCNICENKIPVKSNVYKLKNNTSDISNYTHTLVSIPHYTLKKDDNLCKRCLENSEIIVSNKDNKMTKMLKCKHDDTNIKHFFDVIGDESTTVFLKSSYKDKDTIKKLGGKWNSEKKMWYFTYTSKTENKLEKFNKWIIQDV